MVPVIRFVAYEIDSKVCFICKKDHIVRNIPVKSWLLIPENNINKVLKNKKLMIPEIFM